MNTFFKTGILLLSICFISCNNQNKAEKLTDADIKAREELKQHLDSIRLSGLKLAEEAKEKKTACIKDEYNMTDTIPFGSLRMYIKEITPLNRPDVKNKIAYASDYELYSVKIGIKNIGKKPVSLPFVSYVRSKTKSVQMFSENVSPTSELFVFSSRLVYEKNKIVEYLIQPSGDERNYSFATCRPPNAKKLRFTSQLDCRSAEEKKKGEPLIETLRKMGLDRIGIVSVNYSGPAALVNIPECFE